jgi:Zn finger protein HypA/HybF involved in hydrogenase expression
MDEFKFKLKPVKCWSCGYEFYESNASYHELCDTYICPSCGSCYCSLSSEAKSALDAAMYSYGHWSPYENPPKRKKRRKKK